MARFEERYYDECEFGEVAEKCETVGDKVCDM